jgi:hypothetical protein
MSARARIPAAFLAACALPVPDVLMPGFRRVEHVLVVEASPHFDRLDFYAAPSQGFSGHARIAPGEPFSFSSKYGTRIHALAKGAAFPEVRAAPSEQRAALAAVAVASGDIPVQQVASVPLLSPIEHVRTDLRIVAVEDGAIRLEVVAEHEDWDPYVTTIVALCLAAGVAGLYVLARRRRSARGAPA